MVLERIQAGFLDQLAERAREGTDPAAWEPAWQEGARMTLEEVLSTVRAVSFASAAESSVG
jgi:hypothetical protein